MDNILTQIIATKAEEVAAAQQAMPLAEIKAACADLAATRSLKASLLSKPGGIMPSLKGVHPQRDG